MTPDLRIIELLDPTPNKEDKRAWRIVAAALDDETVISHYRVAAARQAIELITSRLENMKVISPDFRHSASWAASCLRLFVEEHDAAMAEKENRHD